LSGAARTAASISCSARLVEVRRPVQGPGHDQRGEAAGEADTAATVRVSS